MHYLQSTVIFYFLFHINQKIFKELAEKLISTLKFSHAVGLQTRADATQADISVVLSSTIATAELPSNAEVAETLINAANTNETLSVALAASSIQFICKYKQHVGFLSEKYF